jgi:hypothetical protein
MNDTTHTTHTNVSSRGLRLPHGPPLTPLDFGTGATGEAAETRSPCGSGIEEAMVAQVQSRGNHRLSVGQGKDRS